MGMFYKIYGAFGIVLTAAVVLTGTYGLSETDRKIYDTALEIEGQMKEGGFPDFSPADYKVRFFNGDSDYVVADGKTTTEKAAFDTFVGTTSKIDGEYQVILPTYKNFSDMFDLLGTAQNVSEGTLGFGEENYSPNAHVATLWHEAFHAWQCTNWEMEIEEQSEAAGLTEEDNLEEVVVNEVDSDPAFVVSFSREMEFLREAYETADAEEKERLVREALALSGERRQQMSEKAAYAERYFQLMEGSARYVEGQAYLLLEGPDAWKENYLNAFTYTNGSGKYYTMGMLKCLLLKQLRPDWEKEFTVTVSLDEQLEHAIDGQGD